MLGSKFTESSCLVKKNNGKQVEDGLYLSRIEGVALDSNGSARYSIASMIVLNKVFLVIKRWIKVVTRELCSRPL